MEKISICLCVIVGNEEAVIERFIRSFHKVTDRMLFTIAVGNQSEDHTTEIIDRVCEELEIFGTILDYKNKEDWPHVDNFAAARAIAWDNYDPELAEYLLWADADDLISEESAEMLKEAAASKESDVFIVPYEVRGKSQIIYRERMVKNDGCSFWRFPVHELLGFNREVTYRVIKDAAIVHAPLPDKKTSEGRNRTILESAIQDGARHLFFLSQEACQRGQIETFKIYAKAALAHPGLDTTEHYELLINLAQNEGNCDQAKTHAARAFEMMPDRREALALLACYALIDGRNDEAFYLAKIMAAIPMPRKAYWTLNRDWYTWKGFYLLTQTMRASGKHAEAEKLERDQFEKNGMTFSICHPTYLRPEQALAIRDLYLGRAKNPMAVEYIFGLHHNDAESIKLLSGFRHTVTDKEGCCPNTLEPMKASTGKFIMVIADDLIPPEGWDEQILEALRDKTGDGNVTCDIYIPPWEECGLVLNFNDSLRRDGHMCHGFMTRPWLEEYLEDPWPGTGIFSDNEFTYRARKAEIVIEAPEIVFEHRHYSTGKVPMDATYADQNQNKNYVEGLKLFRKRNPDAPQTYMEIIETPSTEFSFRVAVENLISRKGKDLTFLQIGAHDGKTNDEIYPFALLHEWNGIVVEPQPKIFKKLRENYEGREEQIKLENMAIARRSPTAPLFIFDPANSDLPYHATMLASFSKEALIHNGHGYRGGIIEIEVPTISLADLIEKYGIKALDILQIDTEGYDFEILKMLAETELRPEIIRFEHAMLPNSGMEARQILVSLGYKVEMIGIDTIAQKL